MEETINGIQAEIIRKNIKTLRITIKDGRVIVSAPRLLSSTVIHNFVTQKKDWIIFQQNKYLQLLAKHKELSEGNFILLWGQKVPLHIVEGQKTEYKDDGKEITLIRPIDFSEDKLLAALERFYKQQLQRRIALRLPVFETLTNLRCKGWRIRKMVSRWGSCNTKTKALCFSLNLAKRPPECLDYVIIHELTHLAVPNHGTQFKALLTRHCPNWKSLKKLLNN